MTAGLRLAWICGGLAILLAAVAAGSLLVGAASVSPGTVLDLITGRGPAGGTDRTVVLSIRLPRIAAAMLAGGALAVAGAGFQALTRNPLASPPSSASPVERHSGSSSPKCRVSARVWWTRSG